MLLATTQIMQCYFSFLDSCKNECVCVCSCNVADGILVWPFPMQPPPPRVDADAIAYYPQTIGTISVVVETHHCNMHCMHIEKTASLQILQTMRKMRALSVRICTIRITYTIYVHIVYRRCACMSGSEFALWAV